MPTEGGRQDFHESLAERRIREAMERGEFDRLPGTGRPIPDLEAPYDPAWWARRWVERSRLMNRALELARLADRERTRIRVPHLAESARASLAALEAELAEINALLDPEDRVEPGRPAGGSGWHRPVAPEEGP